MTLSTTFNTIRHGFFGNPVGVFISTILLTSVIQWSCMQFLATSCHTAGLWGLLINPINLGSPVCLAANNIQLALANHYVSIWGGAATFCVAWLISKLGGGVPKQPGASATASAA
jgi:hypothetical protein